MTFSICLDKMFSRNRVGRTYWGSDCWWESCIFPLNPTALHFVALCSLVTIFGWVYLLPHSAKRKDSSYMMLETQNSHVNLDWASTSNCVLLDTCLGRKGYWQSCLFLAGGYFTNLTLDSAWQNKFTILPKTKSPHNLEGPITLRVP